MNRQELLNKINSDLVTIREINGKMYHGKAFVVCGNGRVKKIFKTKRGAEGYINKNKDFSYYDDYTQQLVYPDSNNYIEEVQEHEIIDIGTNKKFWYEYLRENMNNIFSYHKGSQIVYEAEQSEVIGELLDYIKETVTSLEKHCSIALPEDLYSEYMTEDEIKELYNTRVAYLEKQLEECDNSNKEEIEFKLNTAREKLNNISTEKVEEVQEVKEQVEESKEEKTEEKLTYTIKEDIHTKTGEKLFVVVFDKRFSKEEFKIVLEQIKNIGGYYSKFKKGFIFKEDPTEKIISVGLQENQIDNTNNKLEEIEKIDIDNINEENFPIDKSISKRENDGHWVFRSKERDHQQEILNYLLNYQEEFKEALEKIEDVRLINKYSRWLNSFKKKYYDNYYSRLKNDANNPSWTTTGRDGRNANKDRKHMTRHDNLMREIISLESEYKEKLSSLKGELKKIEREKFNNAVESNNVEYEFKRIKKEYNITGTNDYFKFPTGSYNAYEGSNGQETVYIIKSWGAWCVVDSNGMEFKDSRSKTIADAKKKANYYLSQLLSVA